MSEPCEHCGDFTDDLEAHKMNHAMSEGLEMPDRGPGFWDDKGRWNRTSRNWSDLRHWETDE